MGARQPWQIVVCPVVIFCGSITPPCFEQTNTVSVSILPETFLPRRSDAAQIIIEGFHGGSWHRQVARQKIEQSWDICGTLDTGMTAQSHDATARTTNVAQQKLQYRCSTNELDTGCMLRPTNRICKTGGTFTPGVFGDRLRSEEHTSELQSRGHLVCRLLLEKKKRIVYIPILDTLIHITII